MLVVFRKDAKARSMRNSEWPYQMRPNRPPNNPRAKSCFQETKRQTSSVLTSSTRSSASGRQLDLDPLERRMAELLQIRVLLSVTIALVPMRLAKCNLPWLHIQAKPAYIASVGYGKRPRTKELPRISQLTIAVAVISG